MKKLCFLLLTLLVIACSTETNSVKDKARTIVTSDGEVDDMDSFIRMLLYANEFDIEGLIYSSSMWHYAGDGNGTLFTSEMPMTKRMYGARTDLRWPGIKWMEELIDRYASVYPNLIKHDKTYPQPEYLKNIIRIGNIDFEGEMSKDSEGSDFIKSTLLDDKPGPVYMQAWGGTNTIARALKSIEDQYKDLPEWDEIYKKVSEKTVLYLILDQDETYKKYIAIKWPDVRVIYNSSQFWCFAYAWDRAVPDELRSYMDGNWFSENIKFNHGPLLEKYFLWGDGQKVDGDPENIQGDPQEAEKQGRMQYDFISEGDSPAYFYLLDFGLRSMKNPSYGGLGGRFVQSDTLPSLWADGRNLSDMNPYTGRPDPSFPQVRWLKTLQNDFAVRADWCVKEYSEVNHAPILMLKDPSDLTVQPGEKISLRASAQDNDGDLMNYSWWQYREAGTLHDSVIIENHTAKNTTVIIPESAEAGQKIHIILQVTDDGKPNLTRYKRVIMTVN
jgi:hypothetical protein